MLSALNFVQYIAHYYACTTTTFVSISIITECQYEFNKLYFTSYNDFENIWISESLLFMITPPTEQHFFQTAIVDEWWRCRAVADSGRC